MPRAKVGVAIIAPKFCTNIAGHHLIVFGAALAWTIFARAGVN